MPRAKSTHRPTQSLLSPPSFHARQRRRKKDNVSVHGGKESAVDFLPAIGTLHEIFDGAFRSVRNLIAFCFFIFQRADTFSNISLILHVRIVSQLFFHWI